MRITLNLATKPFVELRPLLLRLRVAMGLLALVAIGLGISLHALNKRAAVAEARMDAIRSRTAAFESLRRADEAKMRQPQNAAVLERSRFLNGVFARKSFSWTAVMMDLERVLPPGVQVTSIEPQILADGAVTIRLRVSGDRDRAVQLVRNLETSARFVGPRLAGEAAQASEGLAGGARQVAMSTNAAVPAGVEFEIYSGYNPLPEAVKTRSTPAVGGMSKGAVSGPAKAPADQAPRAKLATRPLQQPLRTVPAGSRRAAGGGVR